MVKKVRKSHSIECRPESVLVRNCQLLWNKVMNTNITLLTKLHRVPLICWNIPKQTYMVAVNIYKGSQENAKIQTLFQTINSQNNTHEEKRQLEENLVKSGGSFWGFRNGFQGRVSSEGSFCTQKNPFPPDGGGPVFGWQVASPSSPRRWGPEGVTWHCGELCPDSQEENKSVKGTNRVNALSISCENQS